MTENVPDDVAIHRKSWRLVGPVAELRARSCSRLTSTSRTNEALSASMTSSSSDLVLVYVSKMDKFFAFDGSCPHMGGPLYNGDIEDWRGRTRVVCPWHGYAFDVETGMSDIGLPLDTHQVKVEGGNVYVMYTSDVKLVAKP